MPVPIQFVGPASMEAFIGRRGNIVDVAHYLRQCSISQRRQIPAIYRLWSRNRDFLSRIAKCKP